MEVYKANLQTFMKTPSIDPNTKADGKAETYSNSRRSTVNEDGLRDWNINLW